MQHSHLLTNVILLDIIDLNDKDKKHKKFVHETLSYNIHFNLDNHLILYDESTILTYSTNHNHWTCEEIPNDHKLISVTKDGKRYLSSDNYIYEWSDDVKIPAKRIFTLEVI